MSFSTPYLVYILGAYGVTFLGLSLFLSFTFVRWKKVSQMLRESQKEKHSESLFPQKTLSSPHAQHNTPS